MYAYYVHNEQMRIYSRVGRKFWFNVLLQFDDLGLTISAGHLIFDVTYTSQGFSFPASEIFY